MIEPLKATYDRNFETVIARTDEQRRAGYRIRHQVYCVEYGHEPVSPDGLESDDYDSHSMHCLVVAGDVVAATARLVLPSPLPFQEVCTLPPVSPIAEVSRFCVAKDFRRRRLTVPLIAGLVSMSAEAGVKYWCAVMERPLLGLLTKLGIYFENVGPMIDHHGKRQPCWQNLDTLLAHTKVERRDVWEILTCQ